VPANPAGLLVSLRLNSEGGKSTAVQSDAAWKTSRTVASRDAWKAADFDDSAWEAAKELGEYGCSPWGRFATGTTYGPYATGITDKLRVVYVPETREVQMAALETDASYHAQSFDPTTGETAELGVVDAAKPDSCILTKPAKITSDDWVVVLERAE